VDKFIGDAVMAYWSVDSKNPTVAQENAVNAAIRIHQEARLTQVPDNENFEFRVGVGINQAWVSSGSVGSPAGFDHHGRFGTLAFRLESACKIKRSRSSSGPPLQGLVDRFKFHPPGARSS